MRHYTIRPLADSDRQWVTEFLGEHWSSALIVTRGKIYQADKLPGFIAEVDNDNVGLITYRIENDECEIISLNSVIENSGIGTALIKAVMSECAARRRVWLITTNDNLRAIEFYKKRGFRLTAVHKDAIKESRKLKPSIPDIGYNGIPIRDEIEFEYIIGG